MHVKTISVTNFVGAKINSTQFSLILYLNVGWLGFMAYHLSLVT